jgi:hypothetical protein
MAGVRENYPKADDRNQPMSNSAALQKLRERWRVFGPLWIVFAAWPLLGLTAERLGYESRDLFWLFTPVFFITFFATGWRADVRRIPISQQMLWGIAAPFVCGLLAAALWHVASALIGAIVS